jgi:DnaJ-class molecular chaperone
MGKLMTSYTEGMTPEEHDEEQFETNRDRIEAEQYRRSLDNEVMQKAYESDSEYVDFDYDEEEEHWNDWRERAYCERCFGTGLGWDSLSDCDECNGYGYKWWL